ncbi:mucin-5AC-like [Liolophura sinensis]|uniref:mucin-5AC-like n=1 Tax=Liolophura sinensis TaxID=3198878 RepID=UPI00315967BB
MTSKETKLPRAVGQPRTGQGTSTYSPEESEVHSSNDGNPPSYDDVKSPSDKTIENTKANDSKSQVAISVMSTTTEKGKRHDAGTGVDSDEIKATMLDGEHNTPAKPTGADKERKRPPSKIPRPSNIPKRQPDEGSSPNTGFAMETRKTPDTTQAGTWRSKIPVPIDKLTNGNSRTSGPSSSDSDMAAGKLQNVTSSTARKGNLTSSKDENPSPSKNSSEWSTSSDGGKYMPKKVTSSTIKIGRSTPANYGSFTPAKSEKSPKIRSGMPKSGMAASSKIGKSDTARLALKNVTSPATTSGKSIPSKMAKAPPVKSGKASFVRDQSLSSSSSENATLGVKNLNSPTIKRRNSKPAQNRYLASTSSDLDHSGRKNPTFPPVKCRNTPPTKPRKVPEKTNIKTGECKPLRVPSLSSSSSENASRRKPKRSSTPVSNTDCFGCMKNTSTRSDSRKQPPAKNARSSAKRAELFPAESAKTRKSRPPMHSFTAQSDTGPVKKTTPGKDNRNLRPARGRGLATKKTTTGAEKHRTVENERSLPLRVPSASSSSSEYESQILMELTSPTGKHMKSGKSRHSSTPQPETNYFGCMKKTSSQIENRGIPKGTLSKTNIGGISSRGTTIHRTSGRAWPLKSSSSSENECRSIMDKTSKTDTNRKPRLVIPKSESGGFDYSSETSPQAECRMSPTKQGERDRTTRAQKFTSEKEKPRSREYEVSWPLKVPSASSSSSENASVILMEITSPRRRLPTPEPDVGCFDCMSETSWQLAKEKAAKSRYRDKDKRLSSQNKGCFECLGLKSPRATSAQAKIVVHVKSRPSSSTSSASDTISPTLEGKKPLASCSNVEQFRSARDTVSPTAIKENVQLRRNKKSLKETSNAKEKATPDLSESPMSDRRDIPTPVSREESLSDSYEKASSDEHEKPLSHTSEMYSPERREKQSSEKSETIAAERPPSGSSKNPPSDSDKKPSSGRNEKLASTTIDQSSCRRQQSLSSSSSDSAASRILMEITSPTPRYRKRYVSNIANFSSAGSRKTSPRKGRPLSSPSPDLTNFIPDCIRSPETDEREFRSAKETASLSSTENISQVDDSALQKNQSSTVTKLINMMSKESLSAAQPSTTQGHGQSTGIVGYTVDASAQTDNRGSSDDLNENEDYSRKGLRTYSPPHCDLYPPSSCMKISETSDTNRIKVSADKDAQLSKNKGKGKDNSSMRPYALHRTNVKGKGEETMEANPCQQGADHDFQGLDDVKKVSRSEAVPDLTRFRGIPETPAHSHQPVFPPISPVHRYKTTFQPDHFRPREIFDDDSTPDIRDVEWVARQCEINEARRQAYRHPVPTPRGRAPGNRQERSPVHRVNDPPLHPRPRTIIRVVIKRWRRARAWLTRCCSCEAD